MKKLLRNNWLGFVAFGLALLIGLAYSPMFLANFNADDYSFLRYLVFNGRALMNGELWHEWFIGGIVNYSVFRPMGHVFWLLDYLAFGLDPLGYHVTSLLYHLLAAFIAFILIQAFTRNRITASISALIFAVMPVHVEAVSWLAANYDVWCAIYFFLGVTFFIFYRRQHALRFYLFTLGAFALALSSRETALTFPGILVVYDLLYARQNRLRLPRALIEYVPFAIVSAGRLFLFGHGYRGLELAPEGWLYYVDANLGRAFDPLAENLGDLRWVALGCVISLGLAFRFRAEIIFGLAWIPITLFTTTVGGVNDRSFYIPSLGLALILAIALASLVQNKIVFARLAGIIALIALVALYSLASFTRNQDYALASRSTQAILNQLINSHPTLPTNARLAFVGVPDATPQGAPIFGAGFWEAIHITYRDPSLRVIKLARFPIWLDDLDRTFFFLVDHRRVTERTDLLATLASRKQCANFSRIAFDWNFANDAQGWETWNELDDATNREGALVTRATGNDPFMGSPEFDVASLALGEIEITMRVRATQPTFEGQVYWLANDQPDFSPAFKQSFTGQADDVWHTYRVDLAQTGTLLLGNRITRLRFDPTNLPADIAVRSIRLIVHCTNDAKINCACPH